MESLLAAFSISLAWCLLAIRIGPRIGFVDDPEVAPELRAHDRPATPLGGVGVYVAIHVAALIDGRLDTRLLLATSIVLALGMVDDLVGLSPVLRLAVELAAAVVVAGSPAPGAAGIAAYVAAVILVVLAINAVNLFDGLDGLAGSVGLVSAAGLAVMSGTVVGVPLHLAAALAGFLVFNWHPAKVFLGDAGAYVVGLTLAHLVIESAAGPIGLVVTSGVLGLFVLDLVVTLVRRRLSGRPLFTGDRSHIYDRMRERGLTVRTVALVAAAAQAGIVALVIIVDRLVPGWPALTILSLAGVALLFVLARRGFLGGRPLGVRGGG